jgi:hypothetical protein
MRNELIEILWAILFNPRHRITCTIRSRKSGSGGINIHCDRWVASCTLNEEDNNRRKRKRPIEKRRENVTVHSLLAISLPTTVTTGLLVWLQTADAGLLSNLIRCRTTSGVVTWLLHGRASTQPIARIWCDRAERHFHHARHLSIAMAWLLVERYQQHAKHSMPECHVPRAFRMTVIGFIGVSYGTSCALIDTIAHSSSDCVAVHHPLDENHRLHDTIVKWRYLVQLWP